MRYYYKTKKEEARNAKTWQNLKYLHKDSIQLIDGSVDDLIAMLQSIKPHSEIYMFDYASLKDDFGDELKFSKFYEECFEKNVELTFINTPACDTSVIRELFGLVSPFVNANKHNEYLRKIIRICEAGVDKSRSMSFDLKSASLQIARDNGTPIGKKKGSSTNNPNVERIKDIILDNSKSFNGHMSDKDLMKKFDIKRTTYYKYKKELKI